MKIKVELSNPDGDSNLYKIFGAEGKSWTIFASSVKQLQGKLNAKMMLNQIKRNTRNSSVLIEAVNFTMDEIELDLNKRSR